jgi:arabinofuranan 3-O-arabinosyltransferase
VRPDRDPRSERPARSGPGLDRIRVAGALLWCLLALVVVGTAAGTMAVDNKPEIYLAPWRTASAYLGAWDRSPYLGAASFQVGSAPVAALTGLIQWAGVPPWLSVRLLRLALLTVAAVSTGRLYRALGGARFGALMAGALYVANPYVVVAGISQPVLLPYALLPLQALCLLRAFRAGGGWRWPALTALTLAGMSGMNAGVVPVLQATVLVALVYLARTRYHRSWRTIAAILARCAGLALLLSVYWFVPTVAALATGSGVIGNSESLGAISAPSSAGEVLRGLGLWPLYGGDARGPWLPGFVAYLVDPIVVVTSYGLALAGVLGLPRLPTRLRRPAAAGLVATVALMVGLHGSSPFGRVLEWLFTHVPLLGAFRTTNKAGAGLVLLLALLAGALLSGLVRRLRGTPWVVPVLVVVAAVTAGSVLPALRGQLYPSTVDVPGYWRAAAADLDRGGTQTRVWLLPGQAAAAYRWSQPRPDDVTNSLLSRPALVRTTTPVTSAEGANLLAAADAGLQDGTLPPGGLSLFARYLGVGDILVRHDVDGESQGGAGPSAVSAVVDADPGLRTTTRYGEPGENVGAEGGAPAAGLTPLQVYAVTGARPIVRAEPGTGVVLVDGDGYAVPSLAAAGLLTGAPPFVYAGGLDRAGLRRLLGRDAVIALTDSNRRREAVLTRLANAHGPLLPAAADPGTTRTLYTPASQTVLRVEGGAATASQTGSVFGTQPAGAAENALDGDPATSWRFGDFGTARGQHLDVTAESPRAWDTVTVQTAAFGDRHIDRLTVSAGSIRRTVPVGADGLAHLTLGGVVAPGFRVTVAGLAGAGNAPVGIAEIDAGMRLTRVARLPVRLVSALRGLRGDDAERLARTPVEVVLERERSGDGGMDEETGLDRDLALPDDRTYRMTGVLRLGPGLSEADLDRLAATSDTVRARSTSRAFPVPGLRAALALDGDPDTSWSPGRRLVGESLTITAPPRDVDHVDVTQLARGGERPDNWVTRARVLLDGVPVATGALGRGTRTIEFPAQTASRLTLEVLDVHRTTPGPLVPVSEVDFGGARLVPDPTPDAGCVAVGTLDGWPLRVRATEPVLGPGPLAVEGCESPALGAGDHKLRRTAGWTLDRLRLSGAGTRPRPAAVPPPDVWVSHRDGAGMDVKTHAAAGPFLLVAGEGYDPRWRATVDGADAGPPVLVDGHAIGWWIDKPAEHRVEIRFGPQTAATAALAVSGAGLVGVGLLGIFGGRRDRPGEPSGRPGGREGADRSGRRRRRRRRTRALGLWVLFVAGAWFAGGGVGGLTAVAVWAWYAVRPPAVATLGGVAAVFVAAAPVLYLVGNAHRLGTLSPDLVADVPAPHRAVVAALVLLVVVAWDPGSGPRRRESP